MNLRQEGPTKSQLKARKRYVDRLKAQRHRSQQTSPPRSRGEQPVPPKRRPTPLPTEPLPPDTGIDMEPGVAWFLRVSTVSPELAERWGFAPCDGIYRSIIRHRRLAFRAATELSNAGHHGRLRRERFYGLSSIGAQRAVRLMMEITGA